MKTTSPTRSTPGTAPSVLQRRPLFPTRPFAPPGVQEGPAPQEEPAAHSPQGAGYHFADIPVRGARSPLPAPAMQRTTPGAAGLATPGPAPVASRAAPPNHTGLPDRLKVGIEALSGLALDAVRVHYQSTQPAQLQALAYTQGTDIYVAPGQEQHLPHEAWHVVQQAQGRVQPTRQMKQGVTVNEDQGLEAEAEAMSEKARAVGMTAVPTGIFEGRGGYEERVVQPKETNGKDGGVWTGGTVRLKGPHTPAPIFPSSTVQRVAVVFQGKDAEDTQELRTDAAAVNRNDGPITDYPEFAKGQRGTLHLVGHGNQTGIAHGAIMIGPDTLANEIVTRLGDDIKNLGQIVLHTCNSATQYDKGLKNEQIQSHNTYKETFLLYKVRAELQKRITKQTPTEKKKQAKTNNASSPLTVVGYTSRVFTDSVGESRVLLPWGRKAIEERYRKKAPEPDVDALEKAYKKARNDATSTERLRFIENQHLATPEQSRMTTTVGIIAGARKTLQ